jgi:hypothetical protein
MRNSVADTSSGICPNGLSMMVSGEASRLWFGSRKVFRNSMWMHERVTMYPQTNSVMVFAAAAARRGELDG